MKNVKLKDLLEKLSFNDFKDLPWEKLHVKPEMSISHRDEIIKSNIGGLMYNPETHDISQSKRGKMKEKILKDDLHQFLLAKDSPTWLRGSNRVAPKKIRSFFERLLNINAEDTNQSNPQSDNFEKKYEHAFSFLKKHGSEEDQEQFKKYTINLSTQVARRVQLDMGLFVDA